MPLFALQIKAELNNIDQIVPIENNAWKFDIRSIDGGSTRDGITVCHEDVIDVDGSSRSQANFVVKWPGEASQAYIKIVPIKKCDCIYRKENSGKFVTILGLECR